MTEVKAVIYARFSSDNQREESIAGQIRVCTEYATSKGYTIVNHYIDRAMSGTNDKRPQFQEMIADSEKKLFNMVLVYKTDRFSRNRYDSAIYKTKLKRNGVGIEYACEPNIDDNSGILVSSLLEGFAEFYSVQLATNVRRGMKENALNGTFNGGRVPLGYKVENKRLVIDELDAQAVRMIYEMYADEIGIPMIIATLNERGFTNWNGERFSRDSIKKILRQPKYIGRVIYTVDRTTGEQVMQDNACPRIVSDKLYERVQKIIHLHSIAPRTNRTKIKYFLCGKIHCVGGFSYVACTKRENSRYYRCQGKTTRYECSCGHYYIKADVLEKSVFDFIKYEILSYDNIKLIAESAGKLSDPDTLQPLRERLATVENSIKNIMRAIEAGIFTETTGARLKELETEKKEIDAKIINESLKLDNKVTSQQVETFLCGFIGGEYSDDDYKKQLFDTFLIDILIDNEIFTCTFGIDGKPLEKRVFRF